MLPSAPQRRAHVRLFLILSIFLTLQAGCNDKAPVDAPEQQTGGQANADATEPPSRGDSSVPPASAPDAPPAEEATEGVAGPETTPDPADDKRLIDGPPASEEASAGSQPIPETDGMFPPNGADLLALLGQVSADARCRFPDRKGTWSRRLAGATWTPGLFPGDARQAFQLALTFDDGPDSRHTASLLDWLKQSNVHASFFVVGQQIQAQTYPLIQRILQEGHVLGNHSFRHDTAQTERTSEAWGDDYLLAEYRLTQIRVDMAYLAKSASEFRAWDRRIFGATGVNMTPTQSAQRWPEIETRYAAWLDEQGYSVLVPPARMVWARPPGGNPWFGPDTPESVDRRAHIARAMRVAGMAIVLWDIDTRDWWHLVHTPEAERGQAIAQSVEAEWARGGITLFHDRVPLDALSLLQVRAIDLPQALELVTLDALATHRFQCSPKELAAELHLQSVESAVESARRRALESGSD